MSAVPRTVSPLNLWQVENLRLTAFLPVESNAEPSKWWMDLIGYPPESVLSRPKAGRHQEVGPFEGRKLLLQVQPERVDWLFVPAVEASEEAEDALETKPSAGPFPDALDSFMKVAMAWLKVSPEVTRLAFGAVLFQPVTD